MELSVYDCSSDHNFNIHKYAYINVGKISYPKYCLKKGISIVHYWTGTLDRFHLKNSLEHSREFEKIPLYIVYDVLEQPYSTF